MNRTRMLVGFALVALGVLWLLDATGVVDAGPLVADWWPLAVIVLGLGQLLDRPPQVASAVVMAVIGLVLLAFTTGLASPSVLRVAWPAALVLLGLYLLVGRRHTPATSSDQTVSALALFSGKEIASHATRFEGGSLTALLGGIDLDLRQAGISPDGALLDITALFGGADIVVPAGWRVALRGPVVFGGSADNTAKTGVATEASLLDVRVFVLFGGVEVKADLPRAAMP